jgi:hypothetical protein
LKQVETWVLLDQMATVDKLMYAPIIRQKA